jgi:hypothetical protein
MRGESPVVFKERHIVREHDQILSEGVSEYILVRMTPEVSWSTNKAIHPYRRRTFATSTPRLSSTRNLALPPKS